MKKMIHIHTEPVVFKNRRWTYHHEEWVVEVLAIVGAWAMVRREKCVPFVVPKTTLVEKIKAR